MREQSEVEAHYSLVNKIISNPPFSYNKFFFPLISTNLDILQTYKFLY